MEVLDLIVGLGEMLHRVIHQLLLLLLAGVRLLGQLQHNNNNKIIMYQMWQIRVKILLFD